MTDKELSKFAFHSISRPLEKSVKFVDDSGVPIASDSREIIDVVLLPSQYPDSLSEKARKKVEYNNALMTMLQRGKTVCCVAKLAGDLIL